MRPSGLSIPSGCITPGEQRVLQLAAGGASNDEIARALGISRSTVKNHLWRISRAYGTSGRVATVIHGLAQGDIDWTLARREVEDRRVVVLD